MIENRYQHNDAIVTVKRRPALGKRASAVDQETRQAVAIASKPEPPTHQLPMPSAKALTKVRPNLNLAQIRENLRIIQLASQKKVSAA
jgi:hypothetical protein